MSVACIGIVLARLSLDATTPYWLARPGQITVYLWPIPFIFMASGAALVRVAAGSFMAASEALGLYFMQLVIALSWCVMAFHVHDQLASALLLAVEILLTLTTISVFDRHSRPAVLFQLPWLLWVSVVFYLTFRTLVAAQITP